MFLSNKTFFLLFLYNLGAYNFFFFLFLSCRVLRVLHQMPGRHSLRIFDCYHPALCWSCTVLWLWTWSTFRNCQHSANLLWDDKICRRCYWCLHPVSSFYLFPFKTDEKFHKGYKFDSKKIIKKMVLISLADEVLTKLIYLVFTSNL